MFKPNKKDPDITYPEFILDKFGFGAQNDFSLKFRKLDANFANQLPNNWKKVKDQNKEIRNKK